MFIDDGLVINEEMMNHLGKIAVVSHVDDKYSHFGRPNYMLHISDTSECPFLWRDYWLDVPKRLCIDHSNFEL